jgi:hypothetical protein
MSLSRRAGLTAIALTLSMLGACGDDSDSDGADAAKEPSASNEPTAGTESSAAEEPSATEEPPVAEEPIADPGQAICDAVTAAQLTALVGTDPGAGTTVSADGLTGCTWTSATGVAGAVVGADGAVPSGNGAADNLASALGLTTDGFSSSSLTTSIKDGAVRAVLVFSDATLPKGAVDPVLAALADVAPPAAP